MSKNPRPTLSFADLVGKTNRDALVPVIQQEVEKAKQVLARQQLSYFAPVMTRLAVLERLAKEKFGLSKEEMTQLSWDEEDIAFGVAKSEEPAERGDHLRVTSRHLHNGQQFVEQIIMNTLDVANAITKTKNFLGNTEELLIGHKAGETVTMPPPAEGVTEFTIEIHRVAKYPKAPAPVEAATPAETPAAPTETEGA